MSVAVQLVPDKYTGVLISAMQPLAPLQASVSGVVGWIADGTAAEPEGVVDAAELDRLVRRLQTVENLNASLAERVRSLEQRNRELSGIRELGLLRRGRLIPARIVSRDLLSWRESRLVDKGSLSGVRNGAPVTSDYFADTGSEAARDGLRVLSEETLVGTVAQVGTHTCRVRLLTDPETRMPVTVGRRSDEGVVPLAREFWLVGAGPGRMQVRDVDHGYVERGQVQVGDVVLTVGDDVMLPAPMVIGEITAVRPDEDSALLYVLDVAPIVAAERLRHVYIFDPEGEP